MLHDELIDVQFELNAADIPHPDDIRKWVLRAIEAAAAEAGEIAVRIVDEAEIQALNRDFRHRDKPTNVLSFPAGRVEGLPADVPKPLGDIVICAPIVLQEATDQGKMPADHWAHLLVHGTLHLTGFDHIDDADALEMEALERHILASEGIQDPYVARV